MINKKFILGWAMISVFGTFMLAFVCRGSGFKMWALLAGLGCVLTWFVLKISLSYHQKAGSVWKRFLISLLSALLVQSILVILMFCVQRDPFSAERIAHSGPLLYFLGDRLLRGIFFAFIAAIMYVWAWIPMGILWQIASARVLGLKIFSKG